MAESDDQRDKDIAQLISSETTRRRGKGRKDRKETLQDQQLRRNIIKAMQYKDERRFSEMLRKAGLKDGDERWTNAWKVYRAFWNQS
jgi:hypothetical protein